MKIKYLETDTKCFIQAFNEDETWLSTIVLDIKCDEYHRYKEHCNGNKLIKIIRVETNPHSVGQGIASKLIKLTLKKYKNTNFVLLCRPCKRLENTDTLKTATDVQIFYAKFGFVRTNELLPTMIYKAI